MANTPRSSNDKQVMDVSHPGKAPASSTSRPVIVTNRPIMKDPMVVPVVSEDDEVASTAAATPISMPTTTKLVIKPIADGDKTEDEKSTTAEAAPDADKDAPEATSEPAVADSPEPADAAAEPESETKPEPEAAPAKEAKTPETAAEPEAAKSDDQPTEEAETSPTADTANSEQIANDAETEKANAADAALQKLVDAKEYFLPINSVEKRRTKNFIAIGIFLALLLVAAWADIALDAGLVQFHNVKPLTHFFSN